MLTRGPEWKHGAGGGFIYKDGWASPHEYLISGMITVLRAPQN